MSSSPGSRQMHRRTVCFYTHCVNIFPFFLVAVTFGRYISSSHNQAWNMHLSFFHAHFFVHVDVSSPCPVSMSMPGVHVHARCPCPCPVSMSMPSVHVHVCIHVIVCVRIRVRVRVAVPVHVHVHVQFFCSCLFTWSRRWGHVHVNLNLQEVIESLGIDKISMHVVEHHDDLFSRKNICTSQEAKYVESWPNTTSAWAGWSRFDIPVDRYGGVHSLLRWPSRTLGSSTCH